MKQRTTDKMKEMLCRELDEIVDKGDRMMERDLDKLHDLTDTLKNVLKIEMLEDGDYSYDGDWEARGGYSHNYDDGMSRDGYSGRVRRDSRGRYSRDGESVNLAIRELEKAMHETDGTERDVVRRALDIVKKMK